MFLLLSVMMGSSIGDKTKDFNDLPDTRKCKGV